MNQTLNIMKQKLIELLQQKESIFLTDLYKLMPEINGEYAIYMPMKEGYNPNIVWCINVSQEFIKVFNELLIDDKTIDWNPEEIWSLIFENAAIMSNIPLAKPNLLKTKKECWLPISIKLSNKK